MSETDFEKLVAELQAENERLTADLDESIARLEGQRIVEVNFVVNTSKNSKAPTHYALIDNNGFWGGTVQSFPVYLKDGVPSCSIPNNYGNAPVQAKRLGAYEFDSDGVSKIERLDAAVRIAFYSWQKTHQPQQMTL